jgi:hypothetical protein
MLLELDVTFAHHEDMGESIGVMCGVSVHPDPRLKTLDREGSYIREYIKLHPRQADEPQYAPAVALPERPIEKVFALGCRQEFKCWGRICSYTRFVVAQSISCGRCTKTTVCPIGAILTTRYKEY